MKRLAFVLLPLLATAVVAASSSSKPAPPVRKNVAAGRVPVVVELFTSEGCSSCPAADEALRELETTQPVPGVEILALGQHVDYWNRLGWKDPFSAPQFTERQRAYAAALRSGTYTPQAVVDGRYELVGSHQPQLLETIAQAAQTPRATVQLRRVSAGTLAVTVADIPAGTQPAQVLLAFTETGLTSHVGRGENAGRSLHHAAVVRSWSPLGTAAGSFTAEVPLNLAPQWQPAHVRAVVVVQEKASRRIVGAGSLPLDAAVLRE